MTRWMITAPCDDGMNELQRFSCARSAGRRLPTGTAVVCRRGIGALFRRHRSHNAHFAGACHVPVIIFLYLLHAHARSLSTLEESECKASLKRSRPNVGTIIAPITTAASTGP